MKSRIKSLWFWFFIFYLLVLLKLVVFKGSILVIEEHFKNYNDQFLKAAYERANFTPFKTLQYYLTFKEDLPTGIQNIGGNILLFIPLGFLLPLAFFKINNAVRLILAVLLTSLGFELMQLVIALGSFDVDDLLLNTAGGVLGYLFFLLIFSRQEKTAVTDR